MLAGAVEDLLPRGLALRNRVRSDLVRGFIQYKKLVYCLGVRVQCQDLVGRRDSVLVIV
jgi:hypothetical protein